MLNHNFRANFVKYPLDKPGISWYSIFTKAKDLLPGAAREAFDTLPDERLLEGPEAFRNGNYEREAIPLYYNDLGDHSVPASPTGA